MPAIFMVHNHHPADPDSSPEKITSTENILVVGTVLDNNCALAED